MPLETGIDPWVYGYAVLFILHGVFLYYIVRRRIDRETTAKAGTNDVAGPERGNDATLSLGSDGGSNATDPPDAIPSIDADRTVHCQHCGVDNEAGYRFCRHCVGELNGGGIATNGDESPRSRRMF